jgi:energy-coupling factor transport system substrate-specific component
MSWGLGSGLVLVVVLAAGFAWYEREHPSTKVLALVATLSALAALGRIAFAPLPSVKPTTDIVLIAGFALGGAPGFAVGALAALTSNIFFGQGPWTPWQMATWGAVGVAGAGLARLTRGRIRRGGLVVACALAGLAYGAVLNFSTMVTFGGEHSLDRYLALSSTALPFDIAHMIGNALFALAFGPALVRMLTRFRARFEVRWSDAAPAPRAAPAGGALACVLVVLAVSSAVLAMAAPARAASPSSYLLKAQNADGGWGSAPGSSSAQLYTGWAAIGLAAAGHNPLDVKPSGGSSAVDFLRKSIAAGGLRDTGSLERTIIILRAAGLSPASFGGRNLLAALDAKRDGDGSFDRLVNLTAFALIAQRAAGRSPANARMRAATSWLAAQQNADAGFSFAARGGASGIDDTAAAVQGLAAGGRASSTTVTRALAFIRKHQNPDGGFPLAPQGPSNAQSTAFAVQAFVAAGRKPAAVRGTGVRRGPVAYLRTLIGPDGSVRYSRTSTQTPVWVTAQALAAIAGKALPLDVAPRARKARAAATSTSTSPAPPAPATTTPAAPAPKPVASAPPAAPIIQVATTVVRVGKTVAGAVG